MEPINKIKIIVTVKKSVCLNTDGWCQYWIYLYCLDEQIMRELDTQLYSIISG